jgi:Reverse transcriptase (RNA-dependent DNA polymerase)
MLSNFAKILEKIIKFRLVEFLEKNNLLSKNQFSFRPGLGTENALYSVSKFIYDALDNSKKAMAIFLDLAKAFDTVNHFELCNILPNFGLKSISLKWFKSYLNNRKQIVQINDTTAEEMIINCGVPQGSVLGPLLFILYINSICDLKIDGQIVTYADDTCLLFSGVTWEEVRLKATIEFRKVINHLNHRKLSTNYKKTNYINFSINKDENNYDDLKICFCENRDNCNDTICQKIFKVSSIRYLGLIFDKNMKWHLHVNNIVMHMRTISFSFCKLRAFLPVQTMRIIYLSLFQAIFQYGLLVWVV